MKNDKKLIFVETLFIAILQSNFKLTPELPMNQFLCIAGCCSFLNIRACFL